MLVTKVTRAYCGAQHALLYSLQGVAQRSSLSHYLFHLLSPSVLPPPPGLHSPAFNHSIDLTRVPLVRLLNFSAHKIHLLTTLFKLQKRSFSQFFVDCQVEEVTYPAPESLVEGHKLRADGCSDTIAVIIYETVSSSVGEVCGRGGGK